MISGRSETFSLAPQDADARRGALAALWNDRNAGLVAKAESRYLSWARQLNLRGRASPALVLRELTGCGWAVDDGIDFLLFQPSVDRHQGELETAVAAVQEITALAREAGADRHFQLLFQDALNELGAANYGRALRRFHAAKSLSRSDSEYFCSFFNQILCLENLGYEFKEELATFCVEFAASEHAEWAAGIVGQLHALQARFAIRQGDTQRLTALAAKTLADTQAPYLVAYGCLLPYLRCAGLETLGAQRLLTANPGAYQTQYRLRTLKFILVEDDLGPTQRLGDQIERFYLWVWLWLAAPDQHKLNRILRLRDHLMTAMPSRQVTAEEFLQFENALRWLGLFAGCAGRAIKDLISPASVTGTIDLPLLGYESRLLDLCQAARDQDAAAFADNLTVLSGHPAKAVSGFLLPNLVHALEFRTVLPDDLRILAQALATLALPASLQDLEPGIHTDLLGRRIFVVREKAPLAAVQSEQLGLFLACMARRPSAPIAEILQGCFAISTYDPVVHDSKLAQLILRANREFAPLLKFSRKRGCVTMTSACPAPDFGIHFHRSSPHVTLLMDAAERLLSGHQEKRGGSSAAAGTSQAPGPERAQSLPANLTHAEEWQTRQDVELGLGVSKATAHRLLAKWVDEKLAERRGAGKATEYRLAPILRRKFGGGQKGPPGRGVKDTREVTHA